MSGSVTVFVNGKKAVDQAFPCPFAQTGANAYLSQVRWAIGVGLKGYVASIVVYATPFSPVLVNHLLQVGPQNVPSCFSGLAIPQASFDTGYMALTTRLLKGPIAAELSRMPLSLSIGPQHFVEAAAANTSSSAVTVSMTPQYLGLVAGGENIELIPCTAQTETPLTVTLPPGCRLSINNSWANAWLDAGGAILILYHLRKDLSTPSACSNDMNDNYEALSVSKAWTRLLTCLAVASVDSREQLLQVHGLHILGHVLSTRFNAVCTQGDEVVQCNALDTEFVQVCIDLFKRLCIERKQGSSDLAAATLQGLLLNMRVWSNSSALVKSELRRCFGVQTTIDLLRVHILGDNGNPAAADETAEDACGHPCYAICLTLLLRLFEACTDTFRTDPAHSAPSLRALGGVGPQQQRTDAPVCMPRVDILAEISPNNLAASIK